MKLKKSTSIFLKSNYWMTIHDFHLLLKTDSKFCIDSETIQNLNEVQDFINFIIKKERKIYGITTSIGDLRDINISIENAAHLSSNMIRSHDAGIGAAFSSEIVLGAMILRAHSLSKGYSGFSVDALNILVAMINARIVPEIPCSGSLGASGDLAFLARLGRAMMGDPVWVKYKGKRILANEALSLAKIKPFQPKAKEGLALINGTSFMTSMISIAYQKQIKYFNSLMACLGLFLNATRAVDTAFYEPIHTVRFQKGQKFISSFLMQYFYNSDLIDNARTQNDYCIRCIPQILGPRIEFIFDQLKKIENEINAITDNPLIFREKDFSNNVNVNPDYFHEFHDQKWAVLSGGNFHGENLTCIADGISLANAKIALLLERQITYLLNPVRNKCGLPCYLIPDEENIGLKSGFMIPHYTANALVHKICLLAQPSSLMNCTSANETEDVVSYGATACHKLLDQLELMKQLLSIYLLTVSQAYSIIRNKIGKGNNLTEKTFLLINEHLDFPVKEENGFEEQYQKASDFLESDILESILEFDFKKLYEDS